MRRFGGSAAEGFQILGRGSSVESVVWSVVIVTMSEGVDEGLEPVDLVRQVGRQGRDLCRRQAQLAEHLVIVLTQRRRRRTVMA